MQKGAILIILLQKMKILPEKKIEKSIGRKFEKNTCVKIVKRVERLNFWKRKTYLPVRGVHLHSQTVIFPTGGEALAGSRRSIPR